MRFMNRGNDPLDRISLGFRRLGSAMTLAMQRKELSEDGIDVGSDCGCGCGW